MEAVAFIRSNDWFPSYSFLKHGSHNGYVAVPPTNRYHGKHYDEDVDVHGGLTFSEPVVGNGRLNPILEDAEYITDNTEIGDDWWIFGFDTMHYGDNPEIWDREAVIEETKRLMEQLTN